MFEGFVSFKPKGRVSSHCGDVEALRALVMNRSRDPGVVLGPDQLTLNSSNRLMSAFAVSGLDFGIPPVVRLLKRVCG